MKITKRQWKQIERKANDFASYLCGDGAHTSSEVNQVALRSMVLGWMSAQPWFIAFHEECRKKKQSDDSLLVGDDKACEITQDFISEYPENFGNEPKAPDYPYLVIPHVLAGLYGDAKQKQWRLGKILEIIDKETFFRVLKNDLELLPELPRDEKDSSH